MLKSDEIKEENIIREENNLPGTDVFRNASEIADKIADKFGIPISICRVISVISNNDEIFESGKDVIRERNNYGNQYYISQRGYLKLMALLGDSEVWQMIQEMLNTHLRMKALDGGLEDF